ncbi:peptide MFS transporter [Cephaloticoccus primus]|uniref:peptide MFS transporter n=1 Tax=Cephaloticoccus primus TaxID=1548207 RepID=UPI0009ED2B5F|nr:peptide MFS transporter [Cephaloticoccus primus]
MIPTPHHSAGSDSASDSAPHSTASAAHSSTNAAVQTTPTDCAQPRTTAHPPGLRTLFFTELWERFSYYGMRALLVLFMTTAAAEGGLGFSTERAALVYGYYTMLVYMLSIFGGYIADRIIGARQSVLVGGVIIACGHFTMALHSTASFYLGLGLVAIGTGLLKPNISTMVGSLYQPDEHARRDAGFSFFYMGINLGALVAPLITGFLAQHAWFQAWLTARGLDPQHSWHWAFAAAGIGMTIGLIVYLRNARTLRGIGDGPAISGSQKLGNFARSGLYLALLGALGWATNQVPSLVGVLAAAITLAVIVYAIYGGENGRRTAAIFVLFAASIVFFAVFEQTGSSINLFARDFTDNRFLGHAFPSAWYQSVNSVFIIALAPAFSWLWLRLGQRQPSAPLKFTFGLGFVGLSFALMVPAARLADQGLVSPLWLIGLLLLQTVGELCLSPVGLSTVTQLAPARLVGVMMGGWFLATSIGNFLSGYLARTFGNEGGGEGLADFFGQQALLVFAATAALLCLVPLVKRLMGTSQ